MELMGTIEEMDIQGIEPWTLCIACKCEIMRSIRATTALDANFYIVDEACQGSGLVVHLRFANKLNTNLNVVLDCNLLLLQAPEKFATYRLG